MEPDNTWSCVAWTRHNVPALPQKAPTYTWEELDAEMRQHFKHPEPCDIHYTFPPDQPDRWSRNYWLVCIAGVSLGTFLFGLALGLSFV